MIRILRTVVLARFLAPNDFGLMGVALLTLGVLETFTITGFDQALVQRKGDIKGHLNAAWTVSVIRGFVLAVLMLLAAPLVGQFFDTPAAAVLIRALAAVMVLSGLKNIGVVYLDRDLQFRQRFVYLSLPTLIDFVVSLVAVLILRSVWALVIGRVARELALMVGSYAAHPYRPRLQPDWHRAMELFRFGAWIFWSSILVYFMFNLDDIVVGRVLSAADLGLYQMAFTISALITTQVTTVVADVAFPVFSMLQTDRERLRGAFAKALQLTSIVAFPFAAGLWFVGPTAIEMFLGANWLPLLAAFDGLMIWGLVRSVAGITDPLFNSIGKPYINTFIWLFTVGLVAALIYPMTVTWGIAGAAWATVIASAPFVAGLVIAGRILATPWFEIPRLVIIPAAGSALMIGVLFGLRNTLPALDGPWLIGWAPLVGAGVYVGAMLLARRFLGFEIGSLFPRAATFDEGLDSAG
jgi:O-antigen/teichoic acid export membrane protein